MSPSELEAFLAEMEPDIRAAERDIREIEALEKKGVTSAGKLPGTLHHSTRFGDVLILSAMRKTTKHCNPASPRF